MTPENVEKARIILESFKAKMNQARAWREPFVSIDMDHLTFIMKQLVQEQHDAEMLGRAVLSYYTDGQVWRR